MPKLSYAILRNRDFRLLLLTRMGVIMALQAQAIIVGWQIYSLTGDPFLLGLTGLVEAVPALLCALFAGYVVDISHPQRVLVLCVSALGLNTAALLAVGGGFIPLEDSALVIALYIGVFVSGLARSFAMPSAFAILPKIVKQSEISGATAWQTSAFQIGAVTGPAVAGIIYGGYGPAGAWAFPVMVLLVTILSAAFLRLPDHIRTTRPKAFQSIREGWSFILKHKTLLNVMVLDMFAVLFGGAVILLPAFAEEILHVGAEGLGALRAAPAIGAGFTALFLALRPMEIISAKRLLLTVAGFGVSMIGFGLSTSFWLSMLFLALSGVFDSVSMVIRGTLMQLLTPESMRGRVSSVNGMFIISSNEIGAFESGVAAKFLGLAASVVFGGAGTLIVVALTARVKTFRQMSVRADQV